MYPDSTEDLYRVQHPLPMWKDDRVSERKHVLLGQQYFNNIHGEIASLGLAVKVYLHSKEHYFT